MKPTTNIQYDLNSILTTLFFYVYFTDLMYILEDKTEWYKYAKDNVLMFNLFKII